MATPIVLGLDIGGANLKAATYNKRAVSVPFPLWKQPDKLPSALAELVAKFPEVEELAVTMTGELCDCFETKRDGVNAIVAAVRGASGGRRVRIWSTDGEFLTPDEATRNHLKVAAANWHALATFAGRHAPNHGGLLLDIGTTTSDVIPLNYGVPSTYGTTDFARLETLELVYLGVKRTPICAVYPERVCAELFATTQDVYVVLGLLPEDESTDTADGRPATFEFALARLARMLGGDRETISDDSLIHFATRIHSRIVDTLSQATRAAYFGDQSSPELQTVILSGAGEFLGQRVIEKAFPDVTAERIVSLTQLLGPAVSVCAPAYAVAVLAAESRS